MYRHLDAGEREIRLCKIQPGAWNDGLVCDLSDHPLSRIPPYECLSYTWGSRSEMRRLRMDGQEVLVTANLYVAMRRLRESCELGYIWIDALCINQADIVEKMQQIPLMKDIFELSARVLVWLGGDTLPQSGPEPSWARSVFASSTQADGAKRVAVAPLKRILYELASDNCMRFYVGLHPGSLEALSKIPWFYRTWTLQESILPSDLVYLYGSEILSRDTMDNAAKNWQKHRASCCKEIAKTMGWHQSAPVDAWASSIVGAETLRTLRADGQPYWMALSPIMRQRNVTEPRDKVYGILGLFSGGASLQPHVSPNPGLRDWQVYAQFASGILAQAQTLWMIELDDGHREIPGLPSWVPDWNIKPPHTVNLGFLLPQLSLYTAGGNSRPEFGVRDGRVLQVRGTLLTKLARVSAGVSAKAQRSTSKCGKAFDRWKAFANARKGTFTWKTDPAILANHQQYWQTTVMGVIYDTKRACLRRVEPSDIKTWRGLKSTLTIQRIEHGKHKNKHLYKWIDKQQETVALFKANVIERSMFWTHSGTLGLGPMDVKEGDEVFIAKGARAPWVLRPRASGDSYKLLGICYLCGFMDGGIEEAAFSSIVDIE